MSTTITPPVPAPAPAPLPVDQLWTPQTIIALAFTVIAAGTVAAVFAVGETATRSQTIGAVMTIAGTVAGFYFGSSRGSQAKDQQQAAAAPVPVAPASPVQQPGSGT